MTIDVYFMQDYVAEVVGFAALFYMIAFTVTYFRHAKWRKYPEGRAVMYLIASTCLTILLLVTHGFVPKYEGRWIPEVIFYTPVALAARNMLRTLRKTLGLKSRWLIRVAKKSTPDEDELLEDTIPDRRIKS